MGGGRELVSQGSISPLGEPHWCTALKSQLAGYVIRPTDTRIS